MNRYQNELRLQRYLNPTSGHRKQLISCSLWTWNQLESHEAYSMFQCRVQFFFFEIFVSQGSTLILIRVEGHSLVERFTVRVRYRDGNCKGSWLTENFWNFRIVLPYRSHFIVKKHRPYWEMAKVSSSVYWSS